jgi:ribosome recycling factor
MSNKENATKELVDESRVRMQRRLDGFKDELHKVRTGRATPSLVEDLKVEVKSYGSIMPLSQLATLSAPEPRLIVVDPWDKGTLKDISNALSTSDLGINPVSDGNVLRLPLPELTEERRKELAKLVGKKAEDCKVSLRQVRREAKDKLDGLKDKGHSEDEIKMRQQELDLEIKEFTDKVDAARDEKSKEILSL